MKVKIRFDQNMTVLEAINFIDSTVKDFKGFKNITFVRDNDKEYVECEL